MMSTAPAELRRWDTDFWGFRIAQVNVFSGLTANQLRPWAADNSVECLYLRLSPQPASTIHIAEGLGFRLMDVRMDFAREPLPPPDRVDHDMIRGATDDDLPALVAIARKSHTDSRFYADPHFPDSRCDDFYAQWIANSCHGYADVVLVAAVDGAAVGYATGSFKAETGRIGLIAVAAEYRGRGIGSLLTDAVLARFVRAGVQRVCVATQGANIGAQRFYERRGFRIDSVEMTFHLWLDDA
jgi:dTDP-4-amino-4,6-dideoxy-D-galactose acyltransferase